MSGRVWMRSDHLVVSGQALEAVSLVAFNLKRLGDTQTLLKVSQRMLQLLYARLQEYGICPPNNRAIVEQAGFTPYKTINLVEDCGIKKGPPQAHYGEDEMQVAVKAILEAIKSS